MTLMIRLDALGGMDRHGIKEGVGSEYRKKDIDPLHENVIELVRIYTVLPRSLRAFSNQYPKLSSL